MTRIAFLGLGQMGAPMAARLLGTGHELTLWNRTPEKADPLVEKGARLAPTPAEASRAAEATITMIATPDALQEVVFGRDGVAQGLGGGSALIEMSTVGPEVVQSVAERLPEGIEMIDAPVLGSVPQATDGSLKVFVGTTDEGFERWRGVLEAFGTPMHVGPLGAGASMKLVANSTLGALMSGLGEALSLAQGLGLEPSVVLDVLAESAIGVTVKSKRELIDSGTFPPRFKLSLAAKDLRLVTEAAEAAGRDLRVARAARSWLEEADRAGLGDLDYSAVTAHIRGVEARAPMS
ncbi:MAG TPA: NAD(P)-dependent oxidoreductase [Actinomycetota bacterium]|nr:NAD(P)-dependent oxidoreductase [Actinomycetota bacterium]